MRHSNDENEVRLNRVQHAVRKDPREAAPDVLVENAPACRRIENSIDRVFDGRDEPLSHCRIALCVVETHISSHEGGAHLATSLLAGNRLDAPGAYLVPP